jgi:hypothetical protein
MGLIMSTENERDIFWRRDGALTFWSGPLRAGGFRTVCHGVATGDRSELVTAAQRWRERGILPLDVERDGICELTAVGFRGGLGPSFVNELPDGSAISVVALVDGEQERPADLDAFARAVHLQHPRRHDTVIREFEGTLRDVIAEVRDWYREHIFANE